MDGGCNVFKTRAHLYVCSLCRTGYSLLFNKEQIERLIRAAQSKLTGDGAGHFWHLAGARLGPERAPCSMLILINVGPNFSFSQLIYRDNDIPIKRKNREQGFAMKVTQTLVLLSVLALAAGAQAGTLYLCKAYSGGTFWAQAHCSQHSALIESMVSVPESLPFEQQVRLAEQQRAPAPATTITDTIIRNNVVNDRQAECKALDAQITQYDAQARQPQTGQMQDWITARKRTARDRQFQIRC
jgi:hypothetical protein